MNFAHNPSTVATCFALGLERLRNSFCYQIFAPTLHVALVLICESPGKVWCSEISDSTELVYGLVQEIQALL